MPGFTKAVLVVSVDETVRNAPLFLADVRAHLSSCPDLVELFGVTVQPPLTFFPHTASETGEAGNCRCLSCVPSGDKGVRTGKMRFPYRYGPI